ncbi:hypothetical protein F3Y22_tig00110621pilonHSYRG00149 [Hibiscus syriacus]|uniref:Uncharacterized protein n=1 Tax=Hibiscus syriacus TaxID=106335 RepID=A0A6A2ZZC9_HIBSY|nr:hypothetical protein F3Y22_tig00110621pilonHSYRG00149 [Hibiscus syriacus]
MLEDACRRQCYLEEQSVLMKNEFGEKLQEVCDALETANVELAEERERTATLRKQIESSDHLEEQLAMRQKELGKYKVREMKEVHNALEKANSELVEKTCEGHELGFELWIWESIADRLKVNLEESQALRKELEASLLVQAEQVASLVQELKARELEAVNQHENILQLTKEHDKIIEEKLLLLSDSEVLVDELKNENRNLLENNMKISTGRNLLGFVTSLGDRIGELSSEDSKLMGILRRIVQSFDNDTSDMKGKDELHDT